MKIKYIGGYFELEIKKREEFHKNAISLNSGRSCLDYLLSEKNYKKIYLPYYSCKSLLDIIKKQKLKYEFYSIYSSLMPILNKKLAADEVLLFINYFGLLNKYVTKEVAKYTNVIIDNSQAFYARPLDGVDTFYSPRKFFGVSDGGYLY